MRSDCYQPCSLEEKGINILGTSMDDIDAEDRDKFDRLLEANVSPGHRVGRL